MFYRGVLCATFLFVLSGCTSVTESNPPRTATEQLLISTAADRAAQQLQLNVPLNTKVFVDASNFEGTDSKYAISAIRSALLLKGAALVGDKKDAETVIELRSGALSTDQDVTLFGLPKYNIPIPLASGALATPEIAIYKSEDQMGVAKFAAFSYDAKSGVLGAAQEPQYGFSHRITRTVLIFFSWTENDAIPQKENSVMRSFNQYMPGS